MPDFLFDQGKNKIEGSPKTRIDSIDFKVNDFIDSQSELEKNFMSIFERNVPDAGASPNIYKKIKLSLEPSKKYAFAFTFSVAGTYSIKSGTEPDLTKMVDDVVENLTVEANQTTYVYNYSPSTNSIRYLRLSETIDWSVDIFELVDTPILNEFVDQLNGEVKALNYYTQTADITKQLFDDSNYTIIRGVKTGINNLFEYDTLSAIIILPVFNLQSGEMYSYNFIYDGTYSDYNVQSVSMIASDNLPAFGATYLQVSNSSTPSKRGVITLSQNTNYLLMKITLASGQNVFTFNFDLFLSKLVVRKGNYDTTYYKYKILQIDKSCLTPELQSEIEQTGDEYVQKMIQTLHVGNSILEESGVSLGENWTGSIENGFVHTSGSTAPLIFNTSTTNAQSYLVSFNITNQNESTMFVRIGNTPDVDVYNGTSDIFVGIVSDGGNLTLTPKSTWNGTITNIKLREVQETGDAITLGVKSVITKSQNDGLTGFWNVALGVDNFGKNENGSRNISIGFDSLYNFKTGTRNIAIGTFSLHRLVSGNRNIAIGADSLWNSSTAKECIALGYSAMSGYGTALENNIGIGSYALGALTTGKNNVAIGWGSLSETASSATSESVAVGHESGHYSGGSSTNIGFMAGYYNRGNSNACLGYRAGGQLYINGNNNVFLGTHSGINNTGGTAQNPVVVNNSICIGYNVKADQSNQMKLGSSDITQVIICGNKQLNFNSDGTVTWEELT